MVKPKRHQVTAGRSVADRDLVPDESSEAFRVIEEAARKGRRISTHGLSDDEVCALLLG